MRDGCNFFSFFFLRELCTGRKKKRNKKTNQTNKKATDISMKKAEDIQGGRKRVIFRKS